MNEKINEIFSVTPELEDFINFAQFEVVFKVPTKEGFKDVSMSLLWEGEEIDIVKESAKNVHPDDMLSRTEVIKLETLIKAISKIGNESFADFDEDINTNLKNKLRGILKISSPMLINYMFDRYNDLVNKRNEYVEQQTEDLKKNFLSELMDINPL